MKRFRTNSGDQPQSKRNRQSRNSQVSDNFFESTSQSEKVKQIISKQVDRALKKCLNNEDESKLTTLQNTEKLVPEFDPDNQDWNVKSWIRKIEQLGVIYHWNDVTKSFILQSKLSGQARLWFNRLESYERSWEEWKCMIIKAFPRQHDFAALLDELIARKKLQSESMTKYYQEKVAMCYRCQLSDQATVSCIIKGLPYELRANAQAFQCTSPDELYEGFLSAFDSYQTNILKTQNLSSKVSGATRASEGPSRQQKDTSTRPPPICYRCKEVGHVATACNLPDKRKCYRCGQLGHVANACTSENNVTGVKKIQFLSYLNDVYKKNVKVNQVYMKAYLDTGSELNVIYAGAANALKLKMMPSNLVLKGFNGCTVRALGKVTFDLLVDKVQLETTAVVTDVDLGDVVLIIGQTIINRDDLMLSVSKHGVTLSKVQTTPNDLMSIDMCDEATSYRVELFQDTIIPVGDNLIKVSTHGAGPGDYCTKPRRYSMGGVVYAVASAVLRNGVGYLRVCNIGTGSIAWKKGMLVTRAEKCTPHVEVSSNCFTVRGDNSDNMNIELTEVDMGDVEPNVSDRLIRLLKSYKDCFASSINEIGCTSLGEMSIQLTTNKPIVRKPYRLAHSERPIVTKLVNDLISGGIVRESKSEYASPVILVRKKNGEFRLCVDYRDLNAVTIKDRFPIPHIDDQLSKLTGKSFFTSLDLFSGYHHLKIHADSINKTAFVTPDGLYEYLRVPFGLANAPSVFMRVIQKLTQYVGSDDIITFMDDMLLSTSTAFGGLQLLEKVLVQLRSADLKLNMKKCTFLKSTVLFLGHEISSDGIRPGDQKIAAVHNFSRPNNLHQLRQFLGLCSYFRKYINKFALIAKPLTDLTKKCSVWLWNDEHDSSFNELKQKLCSRPVLALYDPLLPCEVHTDASKLGIAGILFQVQNEGDLKPVFYFSRVTSREESIYHSYELETLAVVESLKRFRVYVYGRSVKVVTDCSAVRYTLLKKDLVPRIARWWLTIQEYDIQIEYRPQARMRHVDALSRNPSTTGAVHVNIDMLQSFPTEVDINMISSDDWYLTIQLQDDKLNNIIKQLMEGNACKDIKNNYTIKNDRLYRKTLNGDRLVVPAFARWKFMQKFHDQIGHVGIKRCEELIKSDYWFPKMTRFIKKYVASCLECAYAKSNHGKASGELHPIPKPSLPMEVVHIDHLGPFSKTKKGYQYILMVVDSFSKFLLARPTRTINSVETVSVLKDMFSLFGFPRKVVSDRNLAFTSRTFKGFSICYNFHHTLNAIACPRANGQVERYNRTLLDAMRTRNVDPNMWTECIPDTVWGMNNTLNSSLGYHPYEIMFSHRGRLIPNLIGNELSIPVCEKRTKASKQLERQAENMKRNFDKLRKPEHIFKKGDLVLWKQSSSGGEVKGVNKKLQVLYSGPYIIQKVLNNSRYEIRSVKGMRGYKKFTGIVAADSLRVYRGAPEYSESSSDDDVVARDDLIDLLES